MLGRTLKLMLGITCILISSIILVTSNELTEKYLNDGEHYGKPFFCTYFKTSMLTVYLVVIASIAPWKETCEKPNGNYAMMDQNTDDENYYSNQASLGDPTYVPIRSANGGISNGAVSGTESDDSSIRSVRFSKMAEVREMSAHEATDALMARLSYAASIRIRRQKTHHKTAKTALIFCMLWFISNYFLQLAHEMDDTVGITLIRSFSVFFTLKLATLFPSATGDKFTITKFIAVALCIGGVAAINWTDLHDIKFSRGAILALFSAFFYAAYLVFVKRKSDTEEKVDIPLFLGFVGLWNFLLMWPIFFILNFLKIELFELPNQNQFAILFLDGFIGTVICEALWLWGCFLTSSLVGVIAVTLQIPLKFAIDILLKKRTYSPMLYLGTLPIFISLMLVALLLRNDDSDPLMKVLKIIYRKLCRCRRPSVVRINDDEQQESLIGSSD